jgi:predicted dehydrogenase
MNRITAKVGFIGAGGIARSHAFAIGSLKYYYSNIAEIQLVAVTSATERSRNEFAGRYGFRKAPEIEDFIINPEIDTVYILGPNKVHADHLAKAAGMPSVKRIYIEKPLCSNIDEEAFISDIRIKYPEIKIQVGFQYLFMSSVREALRLWHTDLLGKPVHFDFKYYHGDYLKKSYRDKRANRLTPAPDGGAMADLGSHAISLMLAFLGNDIHVTNAAQSGSFPDVEPLSDLFSLVTLRDNKSGAAGTVSASRVAAGSGDMLSFEIYCEKGSLRFSSYNPDYFEYFSEENGTWTRIVTGSSFRDISSFPSGHVPSGWLRSMIHAHYVFLSEANDEPFIPDLKHGLEVQRVLREAAESMKG